MKKIVYTKVYPYWKGDQHERGRTVGFLAFFDFPLLQPASGGRGNEPPSFSVRQGPLAWSTTLNLDVVVLGTAFAVDPIMDRFQDFLDFGDQRFVNRFVQPVAPSRDAFWVGRSDHAAGKVLVCD